MLSVGANAPLEESNLMATQHRSGHRYQGNFLELQSLHQRCKSGDAAAEEKIAPIIHDWGLEFGLKFFAVKRDLAQDFAQELYYAYQTHIESIDSIRCWLLKVPLMLAYDMLRKNYRWRRGKDLSQGWYFEPESPEQQILDRLEARAGMKLFRHHERSIVYWRIWRDLPFADIAEKMELKVDNVKRIYQRAIKKLARELAPGSTC